MKKFYLLLITCSLYQWCMAQNVGVGVDTPQTTLHVSGTTLTDSLILPTDAGMNKILSSDENGQAFWKNSAEAILDSVPGLDTLLGTLSNTHVNSSSLLCIEGNYLYAIRSSATNPKLLTIDINDYGHPTVLDTFQISGRINSFEVANGYAYMIDVQNYKMIVVDLNDPTNPMIDLNVFFDMDFPYHIHIKDDMAFVTSGILSTLEIAYIDISVPGQPNIVSQRTYSSKGESSSIAAGSEALLVTTDQNNDSYLVVIDLITRFFIESIKLSNNADDDTQVKIFNDLAFVSRPLDDSLDIFDIGNINNVQYLSSIHADFNSNGNFSLKSPFLYLYGQSSIQVYEFIDPAQPNLVASFPIDGSIGHMLVRDDIGFTLAFPNPNLRLYNLSLNMANNIIYDSEKGVSTTPALWNKSGPSIYTTSQFTGIGNIYPQYTLDIFGNMNNRGNVTINDGDLTVNGGFNVAPNGQVYVTKNNMEVNQQLQLINDGNSLLRFINENDGGAGMAIRYHVDDDELAFEVRSANNSVTDELVSFKTNGDVIIDKFKYTNSTDHLQLKDERPTFHFIQESNGGGITMEFNENEQAFKIQDRINDGATFIKDLLVVEKNGGIKIPQLPMGDRKNLQWDEVTGQIYYDNSSARYKENITKLDADFNSILSLTPVTYTRPGAPERWEVGFIAEEADELGIDELVSYDGDGRPNNFNYEKMIVFLNEVVKKQSEAIQELQNQVKELKNGLGN